MFKNRLKGKWTLVQKNSERTFRGERQVLGGEANIFTIHTMSAPTAFLVLLLPLGLSMGQGELWVWIAPTLAWLCVE
jgi:hypothetical protein